MVDGLFGIFGLGCGIYCLYGYYMLKFKNEINKAILLPQDVEIKKCKDIKGYCREAQLPLLVLGIAASLYGGVELLNVYVGGMDLLFLISLAVLFAALIIYVVLIRKCNQKYFGL